MQSAFASKDPVFDGTFFVAVKTTGIFCRPVCRAKTPRKENVEFFPTADQALHAGYRACKLCKPLEPIEPPALVRRVIRLAENSSEPLTEKDLRLAGIDPSTVRRQFQRTFNITFTAWQRSRRVGAGIQTIRKGANMTTAQLAAGYRSSSGFREALSKIVPDSSGKANAIVLHADWISSPLGPLLALADHRGILMLDFVDKSGFDSAALRMRRKLGNCAVVPGSHEHLAQLKDELSDYFKGARRELSVPLAPHGTEFEMRVWDYLRTIPYAQTRSYGQQARAIGNPAASRAVGAANGRNDLSILIPCHRVIGAGGSLVGYGGGLERKKWLLNHERKIAGIDRDLF